MYQHVRIILLRKCQFYLLRCVRGDQLKLIALCLIGLVANEEENHQAHLSVDDFRLMRKILVRALKSDDHYAADSGVHAEELLEGIANLVACADENIGHAIAARIPIILGAVLAGPQQAVSTDLVRPGEYTKTEKLLAARCTHTMSFTFEGRAAIAATPRLAAGPLLFYILLVFVEIGECLKGEIFYCFI